MVQARCRLSPSSLDAIMAVAERVSYEARTYRAVEA